MIKISGVIITYNEEKFIERCITSILDVVDEIVVVDSFSTDKTKEICAKYGVRFIENPFEGFTTQKNFANDQATYDYVLSLDADEALSDELKAAILAVKDQLDADGYSFNRRNYHCGKWLKYNWYPDGKIRLYNRKKSRWKGEMNLHEIIVLDHPKSHKFLKGDLLHWAYDSYSEHYVKIDKYTTIAAKNYVLHKNKKIGFAKIVISPAWNFFRTYILKRGFMDGFEGYVIAKFYATTTFLKYIKIRELQKQNK